MTVRSGRVVTGVSVPVGAIVGVSVTVEVAVGVALIVGVGVAVTGGVSVVVGVAVAAKMALMAVSELFDSEDSTTVFSGSTVTVLETVVSTGDVTKPVMVIVTNAPAPVPSDPRSQSSIPPVREPTMTQEPLVLEMEV